MCASTVYSISLLLLLLLFNIGAGVCWIREIFTHMYMHRYNVCTSGTHACGKSHDTFWVSFFIFYFFIFSNEMASLSRHEPSHDCDDAHLNATSIQKMQNKKKHTHTLAHVLVHYLVSSSYSFRFHLFRVCVTFATTYVPCHIHRYAAACTGLQTSLSAERYCGLWLWCCTIFNGFRFS